MNRQSLPDLTAFLACWAVLVVAGVAAVSLGFLTLDAFARWLA